MRLPYRYLHIDIIRGLGILLMIVTHILSWHLGSLGLRIFWNLIHLVVVGLVFCSAYLYAKSNASHHIHHRVRWFIKRIVRLYIPFILYLSIHYALWYFFPSWIRGYGIKQSYSFIISSVLLTGGVDIGWLTTLFLQMALLFPFILTLIRNPKLRLKIVGVLVLFSIVTAFIRIPIDYTRIIAWFPWTLVAAYAFIYSDLEEQNKKFAKLFALKVLFCSLASFAILFTVLFLRKQSLMFTDHKYPPDLFYLSYGIAFSSLLLSLHEFMNMIPRVIQQFLVFLSRESYTLFFVHIIVLDCIMTRIPGTWVSESFWIISISVIITYGIALLQKKIYSGRQT